MLLPNSDELSDVSGSGVHDGKEEINCNSEKGEIFGNHSQVHFFAMPARHASTPRSRETFSSTPRRLARTGIFARYTSVVHEIPASH